MMIFVRYKNLLKSTLFCLLLIIQFLVIQHILLPKWYYPNSPLLEPIGRILPGFYCEENNDISVLILGTSHTLFGISPMEMYQDYGIKSYNLSTNNQPLEVSYFTLKEALKSQSPQVVVLDIGLLFDKEKKPDSSWRYMLDLMPLSLNKLEFAKEYISKSDSEATLLGSMVPLFQYHERWKELYKRDFTDFSRNKNFYSKGYYMLSRQYAASISEEEMNEMSYFLESLDSKNILYEYREGVYKETEKEVKYIDFSISNNSLLWILKINELCKENGIHLLATKIPVVYSPILYPNAWTEKRSLIAASICERYGIDYVDMEYDVDIEIDWAKDTRDGGTHLNLLGAKKVSAFLGRFLMEKYNLPTGIDDDWEEDLKIYNQINEISMLQLENDFCLYIDKLIRMKNQDIDIFISASDEMSYGLNMEDISKLQQLGLCTDLLDKYRYSYLALIENGKVKYECLSNDKITYNGNIDNSNISYRIVSSGYNTNSLAQIFIDGVDWAINRRGLNIVVYDKKTQIVLDSVCFDTSDMNHPSRRNQDLVLTALSKYESYMIENEARR